MRKVQGLGLGILAALAMANAAHAAETVGESAYADTRTAPGMLAERALAVTSTETEAFRACIRAGRDVRTYGLIGRACTAPDGEAWYAGMSASGALVTGP